PRFGVNVESPATGEAAEGEAAVGPELEREARRGAHGNHDRAAGDRRLLDELEGETAAHAENRVAERQATVEECSADHLVHRVVATDVLAQAEELARCVEKPGRVESARPGGGRLGPTAA